MDDLEYQQNQALLAGANQRASQHDILAAVAAMANNPGAAAAAKMAAANAQRQFAPTRLGNQGFMLPDTGAFVPSKIYKDEQEAAREAKKSALQATIEARAAQEAQRQADREAARADRSSLALTLAGMNNQGRMDLAQLRSELKGAPAAKPGKSLPPATINKLSEAENLSNGFGELASGFQDKFGGGYGTMTAQNFLGKTLGVDAYADQANWWQNYNDQKNLIRNKLFGSALTASEKSAYDAANITEGMSAKEIRTRLGQQHAATVRARNKLIANFGKGGYDTTGFEEMPEPEHTKPGAPRAATPQPAAASAAPAGVDAAAWKHMTPEERKLFQ